MFESALGKTRRNFWGRLAGFWSSSTITEVQWEELEDSLLQADLGFTVASSIVDALKTESIQDASALNVELRRILLSLLQEPTAPNLSGRPLSVILIIGVNGSGKTTTIAKLAHRFVKMHQRKVLLAAADTFRAAAIEQLQIWGDRIGVSVVAMHAGADPAAVVYEAGGIANSGDYDLLIIDTAGRLHNNVNLMSQLQKVKQITARVASDAPHETWLVLDGTTGQNAIQQAKQFRESLQISGVIVSKLDSSSRGGMIFSINQELNLPIPYIGVGEQIQDLIPFSASAFVDSLMTNR